MSYCKVTDLPKLNLRILSFKTFFVWKSISINCIQSANHHCSYMVLLVLLFETLSLKIPRSKATSQLNQVSKSKLCVSFICKHNKVFKCHYMTSSRDLSDINLFKVSETNPRQKA